jgi:hypothetical protein
VSVSKNAWPIRFLCQVPSYPPSASLGPPWQAWPLKPRSLHHPWTLTQGLHQPLFFANSRKSRVATSGYVFPASNCSHHFNLFPSFFLSLLLLLTFEFASPSPNRRQQVPTIYPVLPWNHVQLARLLATTIPAFQQWACSNAKLRRILVVVDPRERERESVKQDRD